MRSRWEWACAAVAGGGGTGGEQEQQCIKWVTTDGRARLGDSGEGRCSIITVASMPSSHTLYHRGTHVQPCRRSADVLRKHHTRTHAPASTVRCQRLRAGCCSNQRARFQPDPGRHTGVVHPCAASQCPCAPGEHCRWIAASRFRRLHRKARQHHRCRQRQPELPAGQRTHSQR